MSATSGGALATSRFVQGIGAGGCAVQSYAIIQDLFQGEVARRKQSYISLVLTLMPMLAPALGAVMIPILGWRSVHAAMALGGLLLIAVVYRSVRESRPRRTGQGRGVGISDSLVMLNDTAFRCIALVNALSYASIFAYIAGAPVIVIAQLGLGNLVYAGIFASTAAALSLGAFVSARLSGRFDGRRLVWPALLVQTLSNLLLVLSCLLPSGGEWIPLVLLVVSCFARGIISPNLVHAAVSSRREQAGLAAALVGLTQLVLAALSSALLARLLEHYGLIALAGVMAALTTAATALWLTSNLGGYLVDQG